MKTLKCGRVMVGSSSGLGARGEFEGAGSHVVKGLVFC